MRATVLTNTKRVSIPADLQNIPRIQCGFYPTPLEEMTRLQEELGKACPRLFIKRDDYLGTGFGGNKLRKLEYAMAPEIEFGTKTIVTIGGEKSNHARVTAAICARLGLRCVLVLDRSDTNSDSNDRLPASRFVYELMGAQVRWVANREEREETAMALVQEMNESGEKASYLPLGLSFPLGSLGYVSAVREVIGQFSQIDSQPNFIFHSSSSGGTQAGLVAGKELFGHDEIKIVGVSPDDPEKAIARKVAKIVNGIYELLEISSGNVAWEDVCVLDEFVGDGYGIDTEESKSVTQLLARMEGIILDPVYTSKAMAALIDWIRRGKFDRDDIVLFWHTGGQLAHFYAPVGIY